MRVEVRDYPQWKTVCEHEVTQRCLYTEGSWWDVCLSCGQRSTGTREIRQKQLFTLEPD